jgi:hydrogenase maturation protease
MIHRPCTLILGIGNILWADEGFGVRAIEAFHERFETDNDVLVLDGGTQGLYLVQFVEACDQLLVFDAIDYGLEPGELRIVRDEAVPRFTGAKKMSLHQTGFQEVLSAADLLGRYPARLALIGCQPLDLEDWGGPLTAPVRAAIDPALSAARQVLAEWGVACRPRAEQAMGAGRLLANDIDYHAYERRAPSGVAEERGD